MFIIPIRTETPIRRTPVVNHLLIVANVLLFVVDWQHLGGTAFRSFLEEHFVFHSARPSLSQFLGYQFVHGDFWHLLGNMVCLWVFGNPVNAKMGNAAYLMFYVAGGILAAWGYAVQRDEAFQMIGASGAIAAVTTAYLALFPRSRVQVLVFLFVFIQIVELPAMIMIVVKIIVWDNVIVPRLSADDGAVAYGAHMAGYVFGFLAAMTMLWTRAVARDQFDMLALWKRWNQRRALRSAMANPAAAARAQFGTVARVGPVDAQRRAAEEQAMDEVTALRLRISEALMAGATDDAASLYEQLVTRDPQQCLAERQQLALARVFYAGGRFPQAVAAFDRFLANYPASGEATQVRLLAGIIYARDLHRYEDADKHLTISLGQLREPSRREQCLTWLTDVRAALGRPM